MPVPKADFVAHAIAECAPEHLIFLSPILDPRFLGWMAMQACLVFSGCGKKWIHIRPGKNFNEIQSKIFLDKMEVLIGLTSLLPEKSTQGFATKSKACLLSTFSAHFWAIILNFWALVCFRSSRKRLELNGKEDDMLNVDSRM